MIIPEDKLIVVNISSKNGAKRSKNQENTEALQKISLKKDPQQLETILIGVTYTKSLKPGPRGATKQKPQLADSRGNEIEES